MWLRIVNRLAVGTLCALGVILLAGCASDDDNVIGKRDPAAEGAPDVPGAATPAPNAHSGGWW